RADVDHGQEGRHRALARLLLLHGVTVRRRATEPRKKPPGAHPGALRRDPLSSAGRARPPYFVKMRTSATSDRFRMSPKMCCWMVSLNRLTAFTLVVILPSAHFTPKLAFTIVYESVNPQ